MRGSGDLAASASTVPRNHSAWRQARRAVQHIRYGYERVRPNVVNANDARARTHKVALACKELLGNVRIDAPTIAAIAIGSR